MPPFKVDSIFTPTAGQPKAIDGLAEGIEAGERFLTLLGATGTGKTMTVAARSGAEACADHDRRSHLGWRRPVSSGSDTEDLAPDAYLTVTVVFAPGIGRKKST